jgi:hypothetical protein
VNCDIRDLLVRGQQFYALAGHSHVRLYGRCLDADAAVSQTAYLVSRTIIYKTDKWGVRNNDGEANGV